MPELCRYETDAMHGIWEIRNAASHIAKSWLTAAGSGGTGIARRHPSAHCVWDKRGKKAVLVDKSMQSLLHAMQFLSKLLRNMLSER